MSIIIGLLTAVLVLNCLVLGLLVLVQLPKKEAGVGMAFGGGTTDTLFGAGSGNVLTRITKWSAGLFFALCFLLALLNSRASESASKLRNLVAQPTPMTATPLTPPAVTPVPKNPASTVGSVPTTAGTNVQVPLLFSTNQAFAPAANGSNTAPGTAK